MEVVIFVFLLPWWIVMAELPGDSLFISDKHVQSRLNRFYILFFLLTRVWLWETALFLRLSSAEKAPNWIWGSYRASKATGAEKVWFRGFPRRTEWAMWGLLSRAIFRGSEVIRQTSRNRAFPILGWKSSEHMEQKLLELIWWTRPLKNIEFLDPRRSLQSWRTLHPVSCGAWMWVTKPTVQTWWSTPAAMLTHAHDLLQTWPNERIHHHTQTHTHTRKTLLSVTLHKLGNLCKIAVISCNYNWALHTLPVSSIMCICFYCNDEFIQDAKPLLNLLC